MFHPYRKEINEIEMNYLHNHNQHIVDVVLGIVDPVLVHYLSMVKITYLTHSFQVKDALVMILYLDNPWTNNGFALLRHCLH